MKYFLPAGILLTAGFSLLLSCNAATETSGLEFLNGWVRALPPGAGMTAAYGELHNPGNETVWLEAYDSDAFANVSLHLSIIEDGVSRMQEQSAMEIAAGQSIVLEPGGLHLMLMRSTREVRPGDEVEIGIISGGKRYVFKLPVEAR